MIEARPLPAKVEQRLADLVRMGEFVRDEVEHCRRTYWEDRDAWHRILVNCHNRALARAATAQGGQNP